MRQVELDRHYAYNTSSKRCLLNLNEKLKITLRRNSKMINKQAEILNKCGHRNKYTLMSYDRKNSAEFPFKVSTDLFTQNQYFEESGQLIFPGGSTDFWTHGFSMKPFREYLKLTSCYAEDTMVLYILIFFSVYLKIAGVSA